MGFHNMTVGICGTDAHIHDGEFISKFPVRDLHARSDPTNLIHAKLIPGHEVVGTIVSIGKNIKDFSVGDRCVADNCSTVGLFKGINVC